MSLDARFGVFAQEMLRNGPTFFPTAYGNPYPDYPGTSTFMIYLMSLPFGRVTQLSAILPTAVVSALVLVIIYRIGALHSRKWGITAVLVALFTKSFFSLARTISPDMYVSLFTALSFYVCYSADLFKNKRRLCVIPLLLIVSFAFRGPIGLVLPAAVVCGYLLFNKDYKEFLLMGFASVVMMLVGLALLFAAAKYQGGKEFFKQVLNWQVARRLPYDKSHPYTYYWFGSLAKYAVGYPLAVIVISGKIRDLWKPRTQEDRLLAQLTLWMLIILVGLSIPGVKKMRYILPAFPAFALIGAYLFVGLFENSFMGRIREGFLDFCNILPYTAAVFCTGVLLLWHRLNSDFQPHLIGAFLAMCSVTAGLSILLLRLKDRFVKDTTKLGAAALTFIVLVICFSDQAFYYHYRSKPFVNAVSSLLEQQQGTLVFYRIQSDAEAIKFLVNYEKQIKPQFITSQDEIMAFEPKTPFVCLAENFEQLPQKIAGKLCEMCRGRLDGEYCVCFTIKKIGPTQGKLVQK